jgi:DNA polymerase (family 10)
MNAETVAKHHAWIRSFIRKTKYKKGAFVKHARVLCGAEVDVNIEGELDYDAKTLKTLDYVIIAIHHKQDFKPTERLLKAIETVHKIGVPAIIAHPTNRIIGYRPESMVTWNPVFVKCADYGIALEVNGQSDRLDLPEQLIERARGFGCWFVVSSDFHGENPKDRVKLLEQAVMQARRGWLTSDVVVNANNALLKKWLGEKRYTTVFKTEGVK